MSSTTLTNLKEAIEKCIGRGITKDVDIAKELGMPVEILHKRLKSAAINNITIEGIEFVEEPTINKGNKTKDPKIQLEIKERKRAEQQAREQRLREKIQECIDAGIISKKEIAQRCGIGYSTLIKLLQKWGHPFPKLQNHRQQIAQDNNTNNARIINGLLSYGFPVDEIGPMIGFPLLSIQTMRAQHNREDRPAPINVVNTLPRHDLITQVFQVAVSGRTTLEEIGGVLKANIGEVSGTLKWLKDNNLWFSPNQLQAFKTKARRQREEMTRLKKAAVAEEDKEWSERYKNQPATTACREEYLDYLCNHKKQVIGSGPGTRQLSIKDVNFILKIITGNLNLVTKDRVSALTEIVMKSYGLRDALKFFNYIKNSFSDADRMTSWNSLSLQGTESKLKKVIIVAQIMMNQKKPDNQRLTDEALADHIYRIYGFKPNKYEISALRAQAIQHRVISSTPRQQPDSTILQ